MFGSRRQGLVLLLMGALLGALFSAGSLVFAGGRGQIPSPDGTIHACYRDGGGNKSDKSDKSGKASAKGNVRLVPAGKNCKRGEHRVVWNVTGPQDPVGPQGDQGPEGPEGMVPAATANAGGLKAHNNVQPNVVLHCIIAVQGRFPSPSGLGNQPGEPFLREVKWFAGIFAPAGWAFCDGQLLTIDGNEALFSLLGTTYGGDGEITFALPEVRGRSIMHAGQGPGLTSRLPGQSFGTETETLTESQMPTHDHAIP